MSCGSAPPRLAPPQGLGIGGPGTDQVHFRIRQGAVIADGAGEHNRHSVLHAGLKHSLLRHAMLHRRQTPPLDAAARPPQLRIVLIALRGWQ
jgi:hypothetical protein